MEKKNIQIKQKEYIDLMMERGDRILNNDIDMIDKLCCKDIMYCEEINCCKALCLKESSIKKPHKNFLH